MSRDRKADAQECKGKGNDALRAGDYDKAIGWYSEAIKPVNVPHSDTPTIDDNVAALPRML